MSKKAILLATLTIATPQLAIGQTMPNQTQSEVIVTGERQVTLTTPNSTGSRLDLPPLETPATINSIAGDKPPLRGDLDLIDAVTRAPGITSVANPGNGGNALAARGFNGQGRCCNWSTASGYSPSPVP